MDNMMRNFKGRQVVQPSEEKGEKSEGEGEGLLGGAVEGKVEDSAVLVGA